MRYSVMVADDCSIVLQPELLRESGLTIGNDAAKNPIDGGFTIGRIDPADA